MFKKNMQIKKILFCFPAAFLLLFYFSCCATIKPPLGQSSFKEYQEQTMQWMREQRNFQMLDTETELLWNAPREWRPAAVNAADNEKNGTELKTGAKVKSKGIILVHGLGSSPWDFIDIGQALAENGFLARTVLLAGCGTKPEDMIDISVNDWRKVVHEQVEILSKEVDEVFIGGFSAGAALAMECALVNSVIKGVVLFSPAIKSKTSIDFLAPPLSVFKTWMINPKALKFPAQDAVRYVNVPSNAFAQYYYEASHVRSLLKKKPYDKPVLIVLTEHDCVVDIEYMLNLFLTKITNPKSRMVWYGTLPENIKSERIIVLPDYLPDWKISQFAHTGLLFSPENKEYGINGAQRMCLNGQSEEDYQKCLAGADVWYSDWGYKEEGKIHARLTFNPYFKQLSKTMAEVLGEAKSTQE
jgi:esterase/lipase